MPRKPSESIAKALKIVEFISERQAKDIAVLDVSKISGICDCFVICSGDSGRQVRAIYEETVKACKNNGIKIHHCEDDELSRWILIDFFDVILHVFLEEARSFYDLERLWSMAKKINPVRKSHQIKQV